MMKIEKKIAILKTLSKKYNLVILIINNSIKIANN